MTASTVGATATIRSPPPRPDRKRQNTNQGKPSGSAQAKKVAVASSIISRTSRVGRMRLITGRADGADEIADEAGGGEVGGVGRAGTSRLDQGR